MKYQTKKRLAVVLSLVLVLAAAFILSGCGSKHPFTVYAEGDYISPALIENFTNETGIKVEYVIGDKTPEAFEETRFDQDSSTQTVESAVNEALTESHNENPSADKDPADGSAGEQEVVYSSLLDALKVPHDQALQQAYDEAASNEDMSFDESTVEYPAAKYDVILMDGNGLGELAENGLLLTLDKELVSAGLLVDQQYKGLSYDPDNLYTVTTMWEYMGLLVNTNLVNEQIKTWDALWDEKWKGLILMPDNMEQCVALSILASGESVTTKDEKVIRKAFDRLEEQKPLVGAYTNRDAYILMENDLAALYPCNSSTAVQMMSENPALVFLVPQVSSGSYKDNTSMEYVQRGITFRTALGYATTKDSIYPTEAQQFINYMCSVENQAKNAVYARYASTSEKTLNKMDDNWSHNPILYPSESVLKDTELLTNCRSKAWQECKARWESMTRQGSEVFVTSHDPADAGAESSAESSAKS